MEERKVFGSSMMSEVTSVENDDIQTPIPSEEDVAKDRAELIENDPETRVVDHVSIDALSGVKSSSRMNHEEQLEAAKLLIDRGDVRGKTIPERAIKLIADSTGIRVTDDQCKIMAEFFESHTTELSAIKTNAFDNMPIVEIESALGKDISDLIKSLSKDDDDYQFMMRRLISQVYSIYDISIEYTDHMKELNDITRAALKQFDDIKEGCAAAVNSGKKPLDGTSEDELKTAYDSVTNFFAKKMQLDQRNRRLRGDYSIDDTDTKTVESVKVALEDALRMTSILTFISNNKERLSKEFKNTEARITAIKNWITAIKKDKYVVYTFPVNDYETITNTLIKVKEFVFDAILAERFKNFEIPADLDKPLKEYFLENGVCDQNVIDEYEIKAELVLYILSRTFNPKRLLDNYYQRVLSYTLNMLSKLGRADYRERFYELANYIYRTLFTMK